MAYNPYSYSVTQLQTLCEGLAPLPSTLIKATGFFYIHKAEFYLITNRHVIIDEKKEIYGDSVKFYVHLNKEKPDDIKYLTVRLYDENKKPTWLEHKSNSKTSIVDVVAIPINDEIWEYHDSIEYWSEKNQPRNEVGYLNSFINLSYIGYPLGFFDEINNLPLKRSGTPSSVYGIGFREKPRFLLDVISHPGASGSPVYLPLGSKLMIGDLVGVLSGSHPGTGLVYVWYSSLIPEIINAGSKGKII